MNDLDNKLTIKELNNCGWKIINIDGIELSKAFVVVSRRGLFAIFLKTSCPQVSSTLYSRFTPTQRQLFSMLVTFMSHLQSKTGLTCLRPYPLSLRGVLFYYLQIFCLSTVRVNLHIRSNGRLINQKIAHFL